MYELFVDNMHCGGCANRVAQAVQALDAKAVVNVDLKNKAVRVASGAGIDAVRAALARAGYPVRTSEAGG